MGNCMWSERSFEKVTKKAQPTLNLIDNLESDKNNMDCADVRTGTSSDIRQNTRSLEGKERLQFSTEHDVQVEYNYMNLEPINTTNFLQSSITDFAANNSSVTDSNIVVTAERPSASRTQCVQDSKGAQLLHNQSIYKVTQTPQYLSAHTPRKLKLQRKVGHLKKEIATLRAINKKLEDVTEDQFLKTCEKFMSPLIALFVRERVLSGKKKGQGRKYSLQLKRLCLNLYFKRPRAYRMLSSIFYLPDKKILNRMTTNISITSGLNQNVLNLLAVKFATMQESEKVCVICFDEMSLKYHLYYNTKADKVTGFHDSGNEKQPAKYACVFMARSIFANWEQPLAFEFSYTSCSTTILKQLLTRCILELQNIGLTVAAVVCDMGPKNIQLSNELGITPSTPHFTLNGRKIFWLFDVPHLMKATRNMFLKYTFTFNQFFAKMKYVRQFYELDKTMQFRLAPELTDAHVNPGPFQKITRFATQLLSHSVVTGISTYMHFEKISTEAVGTVTFIDKMDKLFDMLNSTVKYSGDKLHAHVFEGNKFQIVFLKECLEFFDSLKIKNGDGQNITNQMKFINGWKVTISGVLQLWECLKEKKFNCLQTRRLNQDPVENFFGRIRLYGGNCLNPPAWKFIAAFKKLLFHNILNTENENCEDDLDNILFDLSALNRDEIEEIEGEKESSLFEEFTTDDVDYQKLDLLEKNSIKYVCRFLMNKCLKKHSCSICENYVIDDVEFHDATIFSFCKTYQNNTSICGNVNIFHDNFIFYICSLDAIFREHFQNFISEKNVIKSFLTEATIITFNHPCESFPHVYLQKLFFRMRLYYTLKFINYNFRSTNNPNKIIIWEHE
ncbi:PREDICTED: transposable element P transposase isoform X2 [Vollenhovia emeryi]|uniref:transposable element P transposase isoform X2 n=1 Tax=Vollenhovia emeryi TaxID=411798 RepID=UPI0005F3FBFC|nr:PREDICTED: transposable element P transposase isoform X2 [Vollenhovia emeryi]